MRSVLEIDRLSEIEPATEPVRYVLRSPLRGGSRLTEVRALLTPRGRLRISGTPARLFADLDPGESEKPIIGLDMIARSDSRGLERAILTALADVDEVVVGVDARSDDETRKVAEAYADTVWTFGAADIGLTEEEWKADAIDFAKARNLGRARMSCPWTLVLDTDEYIAETGDLRAAVLAAPPLVGSLRMRVRAGDFEQDDRQRLARTEYRWWRAKHNQLAIMGEIGVVDTRIVHVLDLRTEAEVERRRVQRDTGVFEDLRKNAEGGDLNALFHLAKHKLAVHDPEGPTLAQDFRFKAEVHGALASERTWVAIGCAFYFYEKDDLTNAELWCARALLDGPRIEAFCFLGDIAEDQGDIERALHWYEAACAVPEKGALRWALFCDTRWGRRAGIRRALNLPPAAAAAAPEAPGLSP